MSEVLCKHGEKVSIAGTSITDLPFANGIDVLAEKQEQEALAESLDKTCTR